MECSVSDSNLFDSDPTKRNSFNHVFMYIPIGPSKNQLYKIIIALLLLCYLIFLGMYKPKAEILPTGLFGNNITNIQNNYTIWSNGCGPLDDNNSIGACPINNVTFWGSNPNNYGRFYITNGAKLSNKTISFVLMKNSGAWPIDLTGVFLTDNNLSYGCEIYHTISSQNGIFYNVICPNIPTLTGNGTSISYALRSNSDIPAGTTQSFYINMGLSAINGFDSSTTSINDIKNTTNNINNSINDSSIDNSSVNDLTSNSAFHDSNGLDAIIKAPLNFIRSLTSSTCSSINLTIPYIDADVSLPCMSTIYTKALGQQLVNLIALVINGVVLYRYCLKILQLVHNAKNPNKDELEVLDL